MRTLRRFIVIRLARGATAILPAGLRHWGHAMQSEAVRAGEDDVAFAWGCVVTSLRIAASYYVTEPASRLLGIQTPRGRHVCGTAALSAGSYLMFSTPMTLPDAFTAATMMFAALKILPILVLAMGRHTVTDLFASPIHALLYFTSKGAGILAVACALAAAASAGRIVETGILAGVLVIATALTFWTIFARLTGRFYGLAQIGRPA